MPDYVPAHVLHSVSSATDRSPVTDRNSTIPPYGSPPPQTAFLYFACFMKTIRREWFGIDRLRLDKYLMLVRKFVAQLLRHLAASKW